MTLSVWSDNYLKSQMTANETPYLKTACIKRTCYVHVPVPQLTFDNGIIIMTAGEMLHIELHGLIE